MPNKLHTRREVIVSKSPLIRASVYPDDEHGVVTTSFAHLVSEEEENRLAHGWGVAKHDHDVTEYTDFTL